MKNSQNNLHPYPTRKTQVIFVEGSDVQMGQQHAEQLGDSVSLGMAPFYYGFFRRILNPQGINPIEKLGYQIFSKGIDAVFTRALVSQIPENLRERVRGVAEASGIPEENFLTTLILPDLLPMLQAHWIKLNPRLGIPVAQPPRFGCSSFIAKGNRFLHGRNLDFPGVAYWDRYPVLQVSKPKKGLKTIGFTSAGVPLAGISGINEAGITVSLHQHYSVQTDWKGSLPFVISEKILLEADTLEKATQILKQSRLASSWAFVVADGKTQDGFIFEANPKGYGIRWLRDEGGVLSHSNFFQSEALKNSDYATTERMNWDNFWRRNTLDQKIRKGLDNLTPEYGVQALSDHTDGFWNEEKIVNRTVSQVYNIQSYVVDPVAMKLYLAEGDCPVHLRGYREYDLAELFSGRFQPSQMVLPPYQFSDEAKRRAKEEYILSFVAAFDENFDEALAGLKKSMEHSFTPEAALVAALVNLRIDGDLDSSLNWLISAEQSIEQKMKSVQNQHYPPEYFEVLLYQGRIYDLKGAREKAQQIYLRITQHPSLRDAGILKLAKKAKPYTRKRVKRLIMPYSTYIPFD
ncbi:MAG: hypothetical protein EBQ92_07790 [Proteobacteria bacterium]|nr:hypothetical protein [Pseudomonadota bacterium]